MPQDTVPNWVMALSSTLFWDVDQQQVDPREHTKWLVERVVERGSWDDWLLLTEHISPDAMAALLPRLRLPPREIAFLEAFLGGDGAH